MVQDLLKAAPVAVFLLFSLFLTLMFQFILPNNMAELTLPFHEACRTLAPFSQHRHLYQAIVCGANLSEPSFTRDLQITGLIHLMVVSGSHFHFLAASLRSVLKRCALQKHSELLVFLVLLVFTLITRASPPGLRALHAHVLRMFQGRFRLNWTELHILTLSGFFTLMFCRSTRDLQSLLLSWIASLVISRLSTDPQKSTLPLWSRLWRSLRPHLGVYIALTPCLLRLSIPHPLAILCNWILGPLLGCILFPVSILAFIHPLFAAVSDFLWTLTQQIIELCAKSIPSGSEPVSLSLMILWIYLVALLLLFFWLERRTSEHERFYRQNHSPWARLFSVFSVLLLFTSVDATATAPATAAPPELIVWNVGQGQWVTLRTKDVCWHFDTGGEFAPWKQIKDACDGRRNIAHYSHWDWDHVGLARKAATRLSLFCVRAWPVGEPSETKKKLMNELPSCPGSESDNLDRNEIREVESTAPVSAPSKRPSSNSLSRVFLLAKKYLVPGDSVQKNERAWATRGDFRRVRVLVLGHHGSQTSTSDHLLRHLPLLRQGIASARSRRYGHPHAKIKERLRRNGIALLRTEDWGSLYFESPPALAHQTR